MTPTDIKSALSTLGGGANKRLGQHFLIDDAALETIVTSASIKPGDRVLEVGPGLGVLTRELLHRGADVVALEKDRRFVEYLNDARKDFLLRGNDKKELQVIHGDAATIHWHDHMGEGTWKFVSNLPYSITSLALRKALYAPKPPVVVVVLVQKEVGERAIALTTPVNFPLLTKEGLGEVSGRTTPSSSPFVRGRVKGSLLSLMVALASSSVRIVRHVPASSFYPPPKVESVVLQIVPLSLDERAKRWGTDPERIMQIAKRGFAHPRKLLASNLGITGETLSSMHLNPKARAEDLTPDDWARLTKEI